MGKEIINGEQEKERKLGEILAEEEKNSHIQNQKRGKKNLAWISFLAEQTSHNFLQLFDFQVAILDLLCLLLEFSDLLSLIFDLRVTFLKLQVLCSDLSLQIFVSNHQVFVSSHQLQFLASLL